MARKTKKGLKNVPRPVFKDESDQVRGLRPGESRRATAADESTAADPRFILVTETDRGRSLCRIG